jgi:hypothetical protein
MRGKSARNRHRRVCPRAVSSPSRAVGRLPTPWVGVSDGARAAAEPSAHRRPGDSPREDLPGRESPARGARGPRAGLVLASDAPAVRDLEPVGYAAPRAGDSLRPHPAARDGDRARAAVPGQVRIGRRGRGRRAPVPGRHAVPRRRPGELGHDVRADVPDGLGRRADAGRPPAEPVRAPPATVARLLRAEPRRRDHQPADERRGGTRPAGHRRRFESHPEHADARRHGDSPVHPRLAPGARDPHGDPGHERRNGAVPALLDPRLSSRPGAPRARHRHARRRHLRHAGRPGVHARADQHPSATGSRTSRRWC